MMKLVKEEQILEPEFRKAVISEIRGTENVDRKNRSLRRYEVYRDKTVKWVVHALMREGLRYETIQKMKNRASNIAICRKIVNKLARVYSCGVLRADLITPENDEAIEDLAKLLDFNKKQKKSDKYRQLFKNCVIQFVPELDTMESSKLGKEVFKLKQKVLAPWQYDVIEDVADHEMPKVYILTDFTERHQFARQAPWDDPFAKGRNSGLQISTNVDRVKVSDFKDQVIADNREDQGMSNRTFIFWSDKYHFTTDDSGKLIQELSPEGLINPIGIMPFINIAEDQDGEFWAEGGEDLVDGAVLVNLLITDRNAIAYQQGWGQLVVTGSKLDKSIEGGPHQAIVLESEDDKNPPNATYINSGAPLDAWAQLIEQYVALLLSTNNLSPRNIAGKLEGVSFPSGISLLIEHSESTESVEDKQDMYSCAERLEWDIIARWQNYLLEKNALNSKFSTVKPLKDPEVTVKFLDAKPVITEKEKLEVIKMRKELGINEQIDLILIDNPELTKEEAEEKLKKIIEEKLNRISKFVIKNAKENENALPKEEKKEEKVTNGEDQ
jgi:hypothetical protein